MGTINSKYQEGFAAVQVVLVVAVVLLVGLVGFFVYKRQSSQSLNNLTTQEDISKTESELNKQQEQLHKDLQADVSNLDKTAEDAL